MPRKFLNGATATPPTPIVSGGTGRTDGANLVPTGNVAAFAMIAPPSGWLKANGAAVSRTTYASLFAAITTAFTGTLTSGSATVSSVSSTTNLFVGCPVSGAGVPSGATIAAIGSGQITLSANATASGSGVALTAAPFGVGDGSTTFVLPDLRGYVPRGFDDGRGTDSARVFGTSQTDNVGSHGTNLLFNGNPLGSIPVTGNPSGTSNYTGTLTMGDGSNGYPLGVATSGSGETRVKNVALLFCIKF